MPVTPMLEFYAKASPSVVLPVTGWMRLPEVQSIEVVAIYASEVNDTGSIPDVRVTAALQYSADDGYSAHPDSFPFGAAVNLFNDRWNLNHAKADVLLGGGQEGGFTHTRLALQCHANFSGTSQGDDRIAPFSAAVQFNVVTRRVLRVPFERRIVGHGTTTPIGVRQTGPVLPDFGASFQCRVVRHLESVAGQLGVHPVWFWSDIPPEPSATAWSMGGDVGDSPYPRVSGVTTVSNFDHPAAAFGLKVWSQGTDHDVAGTVHGFAEIF